MTDMIRILIVEDSESDAELTVRMLKRSDFEPVWERVESDTEMRQALRNRKWDIVLSDYAMPGFDAFAALKILQSDGRDIPFIVVSGAIGEDTAVSIMKAGAHDYLMKDNLHRLIPAIRRELREADMRREKRKAKQALTESLEQYLFLFNHTTQGIIYYDAKGHTLSANPAAAKILGLTKEQMFNHSSHDFGLRIIREDGTDFPVEDHPAMAALGKGRIMRDVVMGIFNHQAGEYRWINVNAVPQFLPEEGKPYRVFATFDDITERKRSEEERRQLEAQLRQAQKMEAVGQLAGGVAHDFNNLLYVITGYCEMMMDRFKPGEQLHHYIQQIMAAAQRATTLVRQLLLFSRKEAMQPKLIDLDELIGNLMKMLRRIIGEHIVLEVHPGFDPKVIFADPGQIEQVLVNLCVNARDAMPEGGRITIETGSVYLDQEFCKIHPWAAIGKYILLTISDTGSGIPHEIQDRIFEPFFTTKEVGKGTGLGLAAVYGIVKSHQGMIHLYSEPGHGTAFKIYFPTAERKSGNVSDEEEIVKPEQGRKELILIAEDEDGVRHMIESILEHAGYQILSAVDGEEAIGLFDQHCNEIELALLDVVMPKANGKQVLDRIKAVRPEIPVFFLTGYSKGMLPRSISPDSDYEIIQKPVSRSTLLNKIRETLDHRQKK